MNTYDIEMERIAEDELFDYRELLGDAAAQYYSKARLNKELNEELKKDTVRLIEWE